MSRTVQGKYLRTFLKHFSPGDLLVGSECKWIVPIDIGNVTKKDGVAAMCDGRLLA